LPKNIDRIHAYLETIDLITSTKKENSLLKNNKTDHIIIFSTITNLNFLCSLESIYVDGTFEYCAKHFNQLFSIHGYKDNSYVPLVFCLFQDKQKETYIKTLKPIILYCSDHGLQFKPTQVTVDFVEGQEEEIKHIWADIKIVGCRFHLAQSWWRKIVGLSKEYKDKTSEIGKWLGYIFGIPFLNSEEVGNCFAMDCISEMPQNDKLTTFSDYIFDTYITDDAIFPPHIFWALRSESVTRTTNAVEFFLSHFKNNF